MTWKETCVMDERMDFVAVYRRGLLSMSELCAEFEISRKTGYKWLNRFEQEGRRGLKDRSRRPKQHPAQLPDDVIERCVALKRRKPHWGPKKIVAFGRLRSPKLYWPAPSTLAEYFKRQGLVKARHQRARSVQPYEADLIQPQHANELWCADFKGQFHTRDRKYCYPLTVTDEHSRFILSCEALMGVDGKGARKVFERLFQDYGLPGAIRTDNGAPFATLKLGFSHLSLWWIRLGIVHERIEPGHPEQNGQHERMHKTLKAEATRPPKANQCAQQKRFDEWVNEFNQERPHEGLDQTTPASHYQQSTRAYVETLPELCYPEHYIVRRVARSGEIHWQNRLIYASNMLAGEWLGLTQIEGPKWQIWLGDLPIAKLDGRLRRVLPMYPD